MQRKDPGRRRPNRKNKATFAGSLRIYALMALTVAILITGFFFAARQHFSSIDYGIRNSRLRKQLDDLETEKRRLIVAREVSVSPSEIKKAVLKLGMNGSEPSATETAAAKAPDASTPASARASDVRSAKPGYEIVPASMSAVTPKPVAGDKVAKKDSPEKDKKNKS